MMRPLLFQQTFTRLCPSGCALSRRADRLRVSSVMGQLMLFLLLFALVVSCSSEPEYADPEAHEKTEQLQQRYAPLFVGVWHTERITDKLRFFECLAFQADGKLQGVRKLHTRQLVTIDGEERYTDWEEVEGLSGAFFGTWRLRWERDDNGVGHDRIILSAGFENAGSGYTAYSHNVPFNFVNDYLLRFSGLMFSNAGGWTEYQKGNAEPSF